jgi:hemerythrin superfamily protein
VKEVRQKITGGEGIFERLASEHGEIGTLLRRVAASTSGSDVRTELYPKIREDLLAHAKAEEQEVYSKFRNIPELSGKMSHSADEHHRIEELIRQLDGMSTTEDRWGEVFRELTMLVQKHVLEEEQQIFSAAKKAMSKEESIALEEQYLRSKDEVIRTL